MRSLHGSDDVYGSQRDTIRSLMSIKVIGQENLMHTMIMIKYKKKNGK